MSENQKIVSANTEIVGDGVSLNRPVNNSGNGVNIISNVVLRSHAATMPTTSVPVRVPAAPQMVPARNEGGIIGDTNLMVAGGSTRETNGGSILRSCLLYGSEIHRHLQSNVMTGIIDNGDEVPVTLSTVNSEHLNLSQFASDINDSRIDALGDLYSELEELGNNCVATSSVTALQQPVQLTETENAVKHLLEAEGEPSASLVMCAPCEEPTISRVVTASPKNQMESQELETPRSSQFSQKSSHVYSVTAFDDGSDDDFVEPSKSCSSRIKANYNNWHKTRGKRGLGSYGKNIKLSKKVRTEDHMRVSKTTLGETLSEDEFVSTETKPLSCKGKCSSSKKGPSKRCTAKVHPSTSSGGTRSEDEFTPTEVKSATVRNKKIENSSSERVSFVTSTPRNASQDSTIFSQPDQEEAFTKIKRLKRAVVEEIEENERRLNTVITSRQERMLELAAQEDAVERLRVALQEAEELLIRLRQSNETDANDEERYRQKLAKAHRKKKRLQRAFSDF